MLHVQMWGKSVFYENQILTQTVFKQSSSSVITLTKETKSQCVKSKQKYVVLFRIVVPMRIGK